MAFLRFFWSNDFFLTKLPLSPRWYKTHFSVDNDTVSPAPSQSIWILFRSSFSHFKPKPVLFQRGMMVVHSHHTYAFLYLFNMDEPSHIWKCEPEWTRLAAPQFSSWHLDWLSLTFPPCQTKKQCVWGVTLKYIHRCDSGLLKCVTWPIRSFERQYIVIWSSLVVQRDDCLKRYLSVWLSSFLSVCFTNYKTCNPKSIQ